MALILPRTVVLLAMLLAMTGCRQPHQTADEGLFFLTRPGCTNTPKMRERLDAALQRLGRGPAYQVLDLTTLPTSDVRSGYPTPTVLRQGRDLFGLPEPPPGQTPT